jgi:site-specific DNA-methyltransferase (cytosine-N4-specific)
MLTLFRNGYKPKLRPSGHDISEKFLKQHPGAIPPNLLKSSIDTPANVLSLANTESNSTYLRRCKEAGIKPHPARFPPAFAEFFIKFTTDAGDTVLDRFAGSNTTGAVAESLQRRWISFELSEEYVRGSMLRFDGQLPQAALPLASDDS